MMMTTTTFPSSSYKVTGAVLVDVTRDFVEPAAAAVGYSADHHKIGSVSGGPKSFPFLLARSFVPPRQAQHPLIYVLTYPGYLCFMSSLERQLLPPLVCYHGSVDGWKEYT